MQLRPIVFTAIVCFAAGLSVATFAGFREFLPGLLSGTVITIQITLGGAAVAVVMALAAAMGKMYGPLPVRWLAVAYIETFRGTSALVQLFWLFFVLPHFGITLDPMTGRHLALGLNVGAYGAEVVRGAVNSVCRGPVGGGGGAQHDRASGAAPHHPAAGLRRHDPAVGQPVHRTAEGDLAGGADHRHRPHLPGPADERDYTLPHRRDLHHRAADLSRHVDADHGRMRALEH
jgi:His/Glu/Gln/Arg/opine family amino acid ABC transporter permease subunit